MRERMLGMIAEYQRRVREFVAAMRAKFGDEYLIAGWRKGRIPQDGGLGDSGGTRFCFHGIGCQVSAPDAVVDFDFGPGGRHDGFDAWRLWFFAQSRAQEYPEFQRLETIERVLGELVGEKVVIQPELMPSPHLCYLASDLGGR